MEKLKIAVYPADGGGCGSYRMLWPALAVKEQFADEVEILVGEDAPEIKVRWDQAWKHIADRVPPWVQPVDAYPEFDVDIMVFQRPSGHEMPKVFEILRKKGIRLICDLDDNFDRIDARNGAWFASEPYWHSQEQCDWYKKRDGYVNIQKASANDEWFYVPEYEGRYSRRFIHQSLKSVDLLITSTPHIANHYKNSPKQTMVIENHVPKRYLKVEKPVNDVPVVGWTGTLATHPYDFKPVGGALVQAKKKADFVWRIVGDGVGIFEKTGLMPDQATGWVSLDDYPERFASLDIVLCPLSDQEFNKSKSWLKPLEAAALGAVPIVSPLPEYVELNKRTGIGLLAKKPRDWESYIVKLVTDKKWREELRDANKSAVEHMTIEDNAWRWLEAWKG